MWVFCILFYINSKFLVSYMELSLRLFFSGLSMDILHLMNFRNYYQMFSHFD